MSRLEKLRALQKRCELTEQEVLSEKNQIEQVVDARQQAVNSCLEEKEVLVSRLDEMVNSRRTRALRVSDISEATSTTAYVKRLKQEIEKIEKSITAKQQELSSALHRAQLVNDELQEAMMERRRVEKVIERIHTDEKLHEAGREEQISDETSRSMRKG